MRSLGASGLGFGALSSAAALSAVACVSTSTSDGATESTVEALVSIERAEYAEEDGGARAEATARFARLRNVTHRDELLQALGLKLLLPARGSCLTVTETALLSDAGSIEFVEAGSVALRAGGEDTRLAPRAFPAVSDLALGVVYTTPDRSADAFPAAGGYTLTSTGGALGAVVIEAEAPEMPEDVLVDGLAWNRLGDARLRGDLELTWTPSGAGDELIVELSAAGRQTLCALSDADGAGVVPASALPSGEGFIALHRLRTATSYPHALDAAEVRFDFFVQTPARFVQAE